MNDYLSMITNVCALITMSYTAVKLKKKAESFEWFAVPIYTGFAAIVIMLISMESPLGQSLGFAPLVMASLRYGLRPGLLSAVLPTIYGIFGMDMSTFDLVQTFILPVILSSIFHKKEYSDPTTPLRIWDGAAVSGLLLLVRFGKWAIDPTVRNEWWVTSNLILFAVSAAVLAILILMLNDETRSQLVQRRLELQANQDGLTGLPNLHSFMNMARNAIKYQRISIFMVDIDDFKLYNDSFGHLQGDDLLREVGSILQDTIGIGDYVARYGGEEFIILCHENDPDYLHGVAGRLCRAVEEHSFSLEERYLIRNITISIGIAVSDGTSTDLKAIIEYADQALYESKESGKNRHTLYQDRSEYQTEFTYLQG
ncbi:GGDEF domain-containing protein [Gorillibacterium timonense]|uniref:GGDEF domain-containing protein n=1 Tax=Gorillibacterium timonense TaxID=1689269 RepID=UPI00071E1CC8|nr:GGDEF domain-containing protein [Gorillibacterium timonense]